MGLLKIQTAQNVEFDFNTGNAGQRILAAFIDLLVMGLYVWFTQFVFKILLNIRFFDDDPDILFFFIIVLPVVLYNPVCEYFWNGRTVGKYLFKLRVVRFDGSAATLSDYILRWLLRTIDVKLGFIFIFFIPRYPSTDAEQTIINMAIFFMIFPFPLVGVLFMVFTKYGQRLGDLVANTVVVRNVRPFSLEDTILKTTDQDYQMTIHNVMKLSDKDIYIIKNVLDQLAKTENYTDAIALSNKARSLLDIKEDIKPVELLRTIVKDYNYLAKKRDMD